MVASKAYSKTSQTEEILDSFTKRPCNFVLPSWSLAHQEASPEPCDNTSLGSWKLGSTKIKRCDGAGDASGSGFLKDSMDAQDGLAGGEDENKSELSLTPCAEPAPEPTSGLTCDFLKEHGETSHANGEDFILEPSAADAVSDVPPSEPQNSEAKEAPQLSKLLEVLMEPQAEDLPDCAFWTRKEKGVSFFFWLFSNGESLWDHEFHQSKRMFFFLQAGARSTGKRSEQVDVSASQLRFGCVAVCGCRELLPLADSLAIFLVEQKPELKDPRPRLSHRGIHRRGQRSTPGLSKGGLLFGGFLST